MSDTRARGGSQEVLRVLSIIIIILAILLIIAGAYLIFVTDKAGADDIFTIIATESASLSNVDAINSIGFTLIIYAIVDCFFGFYGLAALKDSSKLQRYMGLAVGLAVINVYTFVEHYALHLNIGLYLYPVVQIVIFALCWYLARTVAEQRL